MENNPQLAIQEPKGIPFYSVKTDEIHWCKLEPTISAYINSSDMGINASRDQDYGWRLAPEWVEKVRAFKRDRQAMQLLTAAQQGQTPTTVNILYYMYGEELANYYAQMEDNENPFEEKYRQMIAQGNTPKEAATTVGMPAALADFQQINEDDDIADLIDDVITEDEPVAPTPPPTDNDHVAEGAEKFEEPSASTTTAVDPAKPGADKSVTKTSKKAQ